MAFPIVVGRASGTLLGLVTSFTVPVPAGANGELLVITWSKRAGGLPDYNVPAGWTQFLLVAHSSGSAANTMGLYRIADGTEGATVTLVTNNARVQAAIMQRISGHDPAFPISFASAEGVYNADGQPNPPNLDKGVSDDYLWIAATSARSATNISTGPAGYTDLTFVYGDSGTGVTSDIGCATAEFTVSAQAEDPGVFTTSETGGRQWVAFTYAITPLAVAPPTTGESKTVGSGRFSASGTFVSVPFSGEFRTVGSGRFSAFWVAPPIDAGISGSAGTGRTGFWRTGVWVEPLDADGSFRVAGIADILFDDIEAERGGFVIAATGRTQGTGFTFITGQFQIAGAGDTSASGTFADVPFSGAFKTVGSSRLSAFWIPDFGPPGGEVGVKTQPGSVECIIGPGDVFNFEGVSGIVMLDSQGRLTVIDGSGQVLCIVNPSGVVIP